MQPIKAKKQTTTEPQQQPTNHQAVEKIEGYADGVVYIGWSM